MHRINGLTTRICVVDHHDQHDLKGTIMHRVIHAALAASLLSGVAAAAPVPVTTSNFARAETDMYFTQRVEKGCFAKLCHERAAKPVDGQDVIRLNRDTLYSSGVFDLTSPLTVTLPDPKGRFQSLLLVSGEHHNQIMPYGPGTVTITKEMAGTRHVMLAFRTFFDPDNPADTAKAHALQDAIVIKQASPGSFSAPEWDANQRSDLHDKIVALAPYLPGDLPRFGTKAEVDPVAYLVATAAGFGGNPAAGAIYVSTFPKANDGATPHVLTVKDVPVDGFWSVTVYNAKGFYEAPETAVSVNSTTAKKNADGSTTIHFGGDPKAANHLRIMPGWNYIARLYRPRAEILEGRWKFPEAEPAAK